MDTLEQTEGHRREFSYTRNNFNFLRKISNARTGIVAGNDKYDMFYARLSRRVRALGLSSFDAYCKLLENEKNDEEMLEFVNAITTNLTSFFREKHHFEYLAKSALPEHILRHESNRRLRIWSAGCSSGEEPYSIAMTLKEVLANQHEWDASILATDIDSNVLSTAARGAYPIDRLRGIPKEQLHRWFMRGKGTRKGMAKVKREAGNIIQFGRLNLMHEWRLPGPMDIIFCRNVIIYFDISTKVQLLEKFSRVLRPGGLLFVGHSESLVRQSNDFELIGNTIYRKVG
ncbi:MAG: protein-glutamate O-methyltransferase [Gammaproteobacteria bacterium]|nr:protein-glutamate O-methyltransferase [Gammaproteobacteria bacterium]